MRKGALLTLVIGVAAIGNAAAETAYVTDSLRLGLHAASDTSDRPFENLLSGTAVEVLERNTNYARVKLADGREGWVKAVYLVTEKPAAARVIELESEIDSLEGAVAEAKTAQATAQHELMRLTTGISKKSLRQALVEMERHGLVRREVRRGATRRAEYALTPLGESLKLVVGTMYEWGLKQQLARPRPAPLSPVRDLTPRA